MVVSGKKEIFLAKYALTQIGLFLENCCEGTCIIIWICDIMHANDYIDQSRSSLSADKTKTEKQGSGFIC